VLNMTVERALRVHDLQPEVARLRALERSEALAGLITRDPQMLRVCRTIEKVAVSGATVMLRGERGTGEEILAQGVHKGSRRTGKFVAITCAAIPENLLESELFGFEKGAFTGAAETAGGSIETASSGTLFLDEIGDLPAALQGKLLRFLQERTVECLGGRSVIAVDVRIVCATHQDLPALIKAGRFREDLCYRLAEIVINVPALREREVDAELLAHTFLTRVCEQQRSALRFTDEALRAIGRHGWPGNVRELQNVVKRAAIRADGNRVGPADLGLPVEASPGDGGALARIFHQGHGSASRVAGKGGRHRNVQSGSRRTARHPRHPCSGRRGARHSSPRERPLGSSRRTPMRPATGRRGCRPDEISRLDLRAVAKAPSAQPSYARWRWPTAILRGRQNRWRSAAQRCMTLPAGWGFAAMCRLTRQSGWPTGLGGRPAPCGICAVAIDSWRCARVSCIVALAAVLTAFTAVTTT
jgi:DNA-binding NtrC family response regulator